MKKIFPLIIYLLSYFIIIFLILLVFLRLSGIELEIWFSSDTLFLPSLFKDLFIDNYHLKGWTLPGSLGYFPDMFVCFVLMAITGQVTTTALLFGILQIISFLALANYIFKLIFPNINLYELGLSNLFLSLFLITFIFSKDISFTYYIVNYSNHFGAFLMTMMALAFTLKYLKSSSILSLIGLIIIGSIAVLSDKLVIILFVIPISVVLLINANKISKQKIITLFSANILFTIIGQVSMRLIVLSQNLGATKETHLFDLALVKSSLLLLITQMIDYLFWFSTASIILVLSFISFLMLILYMILITNNSEKNKFINSNSLFSNYIIFSYVFTIFVIIAPIINGIYSGYDTIRYLISVLYISIINLPILISQISNTRIFKKIIQGITITITAIYLGYIIFISITTPLKSNYNNFTNYYPRSTKFVDSLCVEKNLKMGLSTYWNSKVVTLFSNQNARVYTIYDNDFNISPFASNLNWFVNTDYSKYPNPIFNFIFAKKDYNTSSLYSIMGQPLEIYSNNEYIILKYPDFKYDKSTYKPYFVDGEIVTFKNNCDSALDWNREPYTFTEEKSFSGKYSNKIDAKTPYSLGYVVNWANIKNLLPTKIKFSVIVYSNTPQTLAIFVLQTLENDLNIDWQKIELKNLITEKKWTSVSGIFTLPVEKLTDNSIIKFYGYTTDNEPIYFDDFEIQYIK